MTFIDRLDVALKNGTWRVVVGGKVFAEHQPTATNEEVLDLDELHP